jgi:regulation of enolase protein 1 (concanavalin A-like superfamily)
LRQDEVAVLRLLTLLSVSSLVPLLLAAPVPKPKPKETGPWFDGWDRPVDPQGDCRFERRGGSMTVTARGCLDADIEGWKIDCPHLLREADGDFSLQFRVRGPWRDWVWPRAGALLVAGKRLAYVAMTGVNRVTTCEPVLCLSLGLHESEGQNYRRPIPLLVQGGEAHLRLERRGQRLLMSYSLDGEDWETEEDQDGYVKLPRKVKVGVFAEFESRGSHCKFEFDQLKFSQTKPAKKD